MPNGNINGETPYLPEEDEGENKCGYCGDTCYGEFCNEDHKKAGLND